MMCYLWEPSVSMLRASFPSWNCMPQTLNLCLEFLHLCPMSERTNSATNWHLTHSNWVSSKMPEMHLEMTESHLGILIFLEVRECLCQPSAARLQLLAQSSTSWIARCITRRTANNSLLPLQDSPIFCILFASYTWRYNIYLLSKILCIDCKF